jgi:hypothetical protein
MKPKTEDKQKLDAKSLPKTASKFCDKFPLFSFPAIEIRYTLMVQAPAVQHLPFFCVSEMYIINC